MNRALLRCLLVGAAFVGAHGCIFSPKTTAPPPPDTEYKPPTSPENVLKNLEVSYRRREPEGYGPILHPEFLFHFQPVDARDLGADYWTHDQDSTQTAALFREPKVQRIDINLRIANTEHFGPDSTKLRISSPEYLLEVDEVENSITTTWRVSGDIEAMMFVRGVAADSTHWYLIDWQDISGGSSARIDLAPLSEGAEPARRVRTTTWGALREHLRRSS